MWVRVVVAVALLLLPAAALAQAEKRIALLIDALSAQAFR
jgi:hypothetical protein